MIYLMLFVFGLCLGSFINAFVWRLHKKRNWVSERSECIHCHHQLAAIDLIPVVSWVLLRGKCRYCKKPISAQYPIVELLTALLFVLTYAVWPHGFGVAGAVQFGFWLVFIVGFVALAVYDFKWMLLPDAVVFSLTGLAVVQTVLLAVIKRDWHVLLGGLLGFLVVGGLFYVLFQTSKGNWIGGGDVKLGFALGILAGGVYNGLLLLFVASVTGSVLSLPLLATGKVKRTTRIPFGPFLLFGMLVVQLWGPAIIDWYTHNLFF